MKFTEALKKSVNMFSDTTFKKRIEEEDATMLKHLPILQKINRLGYLTTESQAGKKSSGKSYIDGKPYVIQERSYISGFMLESKAVDFIKNMGLHTDKNAVYVPYCNDSLYLPSNLDIPLTITIKGGKTEINTHGSLTLPESAWNFFRKQAHINKSEKIVYIFCWDSKWNRPGALFADVVKMLEAKPTA
jgi:hypothetical protein